MSGQYSHSDVSTYTLWPDPWKGPWEVTLLWRLTSGRYECVSFKIEEFNPPARKSAPDPAHVITAQLIRSVPVGRLVDAARHRTARDAESVAGGAAARGDADWEKWQREFAAGFKAETAGGGRPRMWGDEHYQEVARAYAAAWQSGSSPTKSVEKLFQVSHSTAARWVRECRKRGFLGDTHERRAGGIPTHLQTVSDNEEGE
jgi:hypothetical protein